MTCNQPGDCRRHPHAVDPKHVNPPCPDHDRVDGACTCERVKRHSEREARRVSILADAVMQRNQRYLDAAMNDIPLECLEYLE